VGVGDVVVRAAGPEFRARDSAVDVVADVAVGNLVPAEVTSLARFAGVLSIRDHDTRSPSSLSTTTTERCRCGSTPTYDPMVSLLARWV
jgi:hypothetical protein